jgi:hypothetical protein
MTDRRGKTEESHLSSQMHIPSDFVEEEMKFHARK